MCKMYKTPLFPNDFLIFNSHICFVDQAAGFPMSVTIQSTSTVVLGIIVAFYTSIKITIVCTIAFVLMVLIVLTESR